MPYADALSDIDATLSAPGQGAGNAAPAPQHPAIADADAALEGYTPPEAPTPKYSAATHVLAGVNTGLVASTLGMPVDLAAGALNLGYRTAHGLAHNITSPFSGESPSDWLQTEKQIAAEPLYTNPIGGSGWINQQMGRVGIGEAGVPAVTPEEHVEQRVGENIGMMLAPNMMGKARLLSGIVGRSARPLEQAISAGSLPANAAIGAASGAAGGIGEEMAPEPYRPLAYMAGNLVGGFGTGALLEGANAAGRGARYLYRSTPPLRGSARETAAGAGATERFMAATADPGAAMQNIETAPRELVPGSLPTTAELSGDVGLLGAQRDRQTQSPEFGRDVLEQRAAGDTARMGHLEGQAPAAASIEDTQNYLRRYLADLDTTTESDVAAARAGASKSMLTMSLTPEEAGAAARGAVEAERAPETAALTSAEQTAGANLNKATGQFGGVEALGSPEERALAPAGYGAAMREPLAAAYATEQQRLRAMREAIDPSGTMGMRPDPIKTAVSQIGEMFPAEGGATLSGAERNLYNTVGEWGNLIPVERAFQLRANINGRLRGLQGSDPQEALRLGILKQGVDQAIAEAAAHIDVGEQAGVIHQGMPGITARIGDLANQGQVGPSFARDVARAYAANPAALRAAGRDETGRGILETANQPTEPVRAGAIPPGGGRPGEGSGGLGGGASDQGIPQTPSLTPLTPEARERFAEWNAGYRQMGQTFRGETPGTLHAVGKILQKGGAYDSYRLTDAEVPWIVANKGANARQAVDRFLAAAPEEAHGALDDALAFSLRRAAQKPDGTLDLSKYETWLKQYNGALSARPELAAKFNTAAKAQQSLDDIRQSLAQHTRDHPLKPGWSDAGLLPRFFRPGAEGATGMREYARITGGRPEALDAATDYAAFSFAQAAVRDGEVVPGKADTWLRTHESALSEMPGLRDRFANATEAQRSVERAIEAHQAARNEFTKSVAGMFLQDDPARAIERVFDGANRQQKAALLMNLTKGEAAAQEGLRRAAVDYIRRRFEGALTAGSEDGALMPKRLSNFVDQNRDVLSTLFPGRIGNFDAIVRDLERSSQVARAKVNKGGSDTAELTAGRGHGEGHGTDIGTATAAILAERMGEHVGHHLSGILGPLGHIFGTAAAAGSVAGKIMFSRARNALQARQDALFDQMLLSPNFALEMSRAHPTKSAAGADGAAQRLRGRVIQQMILSARGAGMVGGGSAGQ
jgi:hypothetical protein